MDEVGVAAFLFPNTEKVDDAILFVHTESLRDISFAGSDGILELTGLEVVEIELAPIVALGEPKDFVGSRKKAPVRPIAAAFEIRFHFFVDHIANASGHGIRHAESGALVFARGRNESELVAIGAPFDVRK